MRMVFKHAFVILSLKLTPDLRETTTSFKGSIKQKYNYIRKQFLTSLFVMISLVLNAALSNQHDVENLVLKDIDEFTIDRRTNFVKKPREAYFPTIHAFKSKKSLKYYSEQAENFTPYAYATKTGAMLIQFAGKFQSVKHFLRFNYPSVATHSVPQKEKNNRAMMRIGKLVLLIPALGILANAILKQLIS